MNMQVREPGFGVSAQLWEQIDQERKAMRRRKKRRRRWLLTGMIGVCLLVIFVLNFIVGVDQVSGDSMAPGIQDGDWILYSRWPQEYPRGAVVVFTLPEGDAVKRIIGIGGDEVQSLGNGFININGQQAEEDYAIPQQKEEAYQVTVPENSFFLLGDHRAVSIDSRDKQIGTIGKERIRGRVIAVLRWGME